LASITGNYQLPGSAGAINSDIVDLEQLRADPSYLAYYYSHANLNPRLPPPLLTRERIHLVQQLAAGRLKALDEENSSGRSLFLSQSMLPPHPEQPELEDEKLGIRKQVRGGDGSSAYASRSSSIASLLQARISSSISFLASTALTVSFDAQLIAHIIRHLVWLHSHAAHWEC
jgi:hypothetical protein